MFLAKAFDARMFDKDADPKRIHYWVVGKSKGKFPHLVAFRTTHFIDPKCEAILNRGEGILFKFKDISKKYPTLVLKNWQYQLSVVSG